MLLSFSPWLHARSILLRPLLTTGLTFLWVGCISEHRCPAGYIKGRGACELIEGNIAVDAGRERIDPAGEMARGDAGSRAVSYDDAGEPPFDGSRPEIDAQVPIPQSTACPGPACDFTSLCGGDNYTCGLIASGRAVCWGDNGWGQLGRAGAARGFGYVEIKQGEPLGGISQVACGVRHACAVLDDASVRCWGAGEDGQLGRSVIGDATYASERVDVPAAQQVVAGLDASCARLSDGTVTCWGRNEVGQLGRGRSSDEVLSPQVLAGLDGVVSLALRTHTVFAIAGEERTVFAWGQGRGAEPVPIYDETWGATVKGAELLAAGGAHGCFVAGVEKRVLCTGWDAWGQIGQGAQPCDGEWCENARPVRSAEGLDSVLSGVDGLVLSAHSACARRDGRLHCWGANSYGELGIGVKNFSEFDETKTLIRTVAVTVLSPESEQGLLSDVGHFGGGYRHFCAARRPGELFCWGHGALGQLGIPLDSVARPMVVPMPSGLSPP